jgi:periplasmic protein TonB
MKVILTWAGVMLVLLACGSQPKTTPEAGNVVPPTAVSPAHPVYPESARKAGVEGTPVVEITIGADGAVLACSLVTGSGNSLLDQAALDAARGTKFSPGTRDGKPVEMKIKVPYRFKLDDSHSEKRSDAQDVKDWAGRFVPGMPAMEV